MSSVVYEVSLARSAKKEVKLLDGCDPSTRSSSLQVVGQQPAPSRLPEARRGAESMEAPRGCLSDPLYDRK